MAYVMAQLFETLRYKSESCDLDSRRGHEDFTWTYLFKPHYDPGVDK